MIGAGVVGEAASVGNGGALGNRGEVEECRPNVISSLLGVIGE